MWDGAFPLLNTIDLWIMGIQWPKVYIPIYITIRYNIHFSIFRMVFLSRFYII